MLFFLFLFLCDGSSRFEWHIDVEIVLILTTCTVVQFVLLLLRVFH